MSAKYGTPEWDAARARHRRRMNIAHIVQLALLAALVMIKVWEAVTR